MKKPKDISELHQCIQTDLFDFEYSQVISYSLLLGMIKFNQTFIEPCSNVLWKLERMKEHRVYSGALHGGGKQSWGNANICSQKIVEYSTRLARISSSFKSYYKSIELLL